MSKLPWAAICGLFLTAAGWAEPDGAVAAPARWTGPQGPPSRSRRSRALAVTRDVVSAWALPLPDVPTAPPVTWDGTAYVLCRARDGQILVAADVTTGKLLAKKALPGSPAGPLHVWADIVYLVTKPNQVTGLKRVGGTFIEKWKYTGKAAVESMTVHENEVYLVSDGALHRTGPGFSSPIWSAGRRTVGPPTIYGHSVLAVTNDGSCHRLTSFDRRTGEEVSMTRISATEGRGGAVEITAGAEHLLVHTSWGVETEGGRASDGFVNYAFANNLVTELDCQGFLSFRVKAAVYEGGLVTCENDSEWQWWKGDGGEVIAMRRYSPDLFKQLVPPTVVGNVVYFGTWAADIQTSEILWRLPLRAVAFGVVPADRLFLVIEDQTLHAFKSRVGS
jgi:hypothetical protein